MVKRKLKYGRMSLKAESKAATRRQNNVHVIFPSTVQPKVMSTRHFATRLQHTIKDIVLRGTFHQGDVRFSDLSRGRQCTANAAYAIAMSHIIALTSWTTDTIDNVLLGGDKLYIDSILKRNVPDGAEMNRDFLRVTELKPCLELLQNKVNLLINELIATDGNLIQDFEGFPNLQNGLNSFFNEHASGILTTRGISLAIFKTCGYFWIFDSHARGPNGRLCAENSAACLLRFNNIDRLYDVLQFNLSLASISTALIDCQYTITPIYALYVSSELNGDRMVSNPNSVPSQRVVTRVEADVLERSTHSDALQLTNENQFSTAAADVPLKRKQPDQAENAQPKEKKKKVQVKSTDINKSQQNDEQSEELLPEQCINLPSTPTVGFEKSHKHEHEFHRAIWKFADNPCNICNKLFYKAQVHNFGINDVIRSLLPSELKDSTSLLMCNRCETTMKKGKCPTQAYWNAMFLDPIPEVIENLTDIERRLISMVVPFIKIIKLGGRFGQYGFKGQAVLFAQDLEEVVEQLPLSLTSAGIAIVCETLENVSRVREFQVDVEKLWSALVWLKENNPLYRNVHIDYGNTNFDLTQICQITNVSAEISHVPEKAPPSKGMKQIKGNRQILRGSFHQNDEHFSPASRGRQCTAIAAVAIVMSHIQLLPFWTTYTVDAVLINGDRLYTESTSKGNVSQTTDMDFGYITVAELHRKITLLGNICDFVIDDEASVHGHMEKDDSKAGFRNLNSGLDMFFKNYSHGILMVNSMSVAVFKTQEHFWIFDSNSRGPNGRKAKHGVACLMQFKTIDSLFKLLKCNVEKSADSKFGGQYSIVPVNVLVQLNASVHTQGNINTPPHSERIDENPVIMTSILRPIDECVPQVESLVRGSVDANGVSLIDIPLRALHRKTAPPLQMHVERRAEELAWFHLFPFGRNGLHEPSRPLAITPLDYCQARVMSASKRFQRNDYLFYALSVMEYYRARQNVGVCLRLRQGDTRPEGLVQNLYLNMRSLRGSNAYWHTASSDLVAMVRNLGAPTWFVTLSCNDLNWKDMLTACLIAAGREAENPDDLQWNDKMKLIEQHPVTLSRQFMVRLHAMMRVLKHDDNVLGGKLVDYWWRIEFQNRGSPHLHMLCWNEGVPPFETPQGIAVIDKVISCALRPENERLAEIVQRVQIHHHSPTCYKNRPDGLCRFSFPRQCSEGTRILDADETIRNKGRFCILKRAFEDRCVNNYSALLLMLWGGNMDVQPCGNVIAIAYYVAKYAAKSEPQDVGQAVREAVRRVQRFGGDIGKQLFAVSMAIMRHRQVSAPECAFRLCHLKLRDSTRKVVFVNTCRPDERYRMLRCDSSEGQVHTNIFDRYIMRPHNLEDLSLAEFAVQYEHVSNLNNNESDELGDCEVYADPHEASTSSKIIRLQNGFRMKKRRRNAILKTRHYTQAGNREGYFYSYLVAHIPFRDEEELIGEYESAEIAFNAKHHLLRPLQPGQNASEFQHLERELHQVIAQVLALQEFETHDKREPNVHCQINDQVEAIIEGHEPDLVDFDIQDDGNNNGEEYVMTAEEFSACTRSMNVEQKQLFDKITATIREDIRSNGQTVDTLKLFVTGGAGCGKTFLLNMMVHQIKLCYVPTVDSLLKATFVEICALTGVAARLIRGRTLHSAFSLGIEKGKASVYRQLSGQRLEDLRRKWKHIRWLIIDEISMVSYEILRCIHLRLQELKNNNVPFGGVHVIVFGDIMQLPPVKGSWCFIRPGNYSAEPDLWSLFGFCELRANMRQQNDATFVDLLNNLRVGELTIEQNEILLDRTRVPEIDEFADGEAVRIFPTLKLVDTYNNKMIQSLGSVERVYSINARDESREPQTYGQTPPVSAVPSDPNKTGGYLSSIKLAIGSRVMLRTNIRVSEGLVNGALGVIRGFEWQALRRDQLEDGELPKKVLIQFDDPLVGGSFKETSGFVAISPGSVTYQGNKGFGNIERVMLPLILSWAVTVHKLQGISVDKAVVYLGKKLFAKGQAYVALSRVRSIAGLVISELDRRKLFNHPYDQRALEELNRLRSVNNDSRI